MSNKKINKTLIIAISCIDSRVSGYIMRSALEYANKNGDYDYLVVTPTKSEKENHLSITTDVLSWFLAKLDYGFDVLSRNVGIDGFSHPILTKKLISILTGYEKKYEKVIYHIHSFHNVPYSMPVIVEHIKRKRFHCVYTVYDSWAYTGGCYNHEQYNCNGYLHGCAECRFGYNEYHGRRWFGSNRDVAHEKYLNKINISFPKELLTLVPVSDYCKERLEETPLKRYEMVVIKPETTIREIETDRDVRRELGIAEDKKIVVSACAFWSKLKGVDYIYKIADKIPENYVLLVIGGSFDKKGRENIVHVPFCDNIKELPLFLRVADVFVSVTQGDTFNVTIVEAQLLGVPVVGFGHGGTPETITDRSGIMVGTDNDVDKLVEKIVFVAEKKPFSKKDIIESGMRFSKGSSKEKYFEIYKKCGGEK